MQARPSYMHKYWPVDPSCVLYLEGQEDAHSATIRDLSGSGNNGTITGALYKRNSKGLWTLDFDGADDKIVVTDAASIQNIFDGSGGTAQAWVNPDSDGGSDSGMIFVKTGEGAFGYNLSTRDEAGGYVALYFTYYFTGVGQWKTTVSLPINTYSLATVTYDADATTNNPTIYINNTAYTIGDGLTESITPTGTRISDATKDLVIGFSAAKGFDGEIILPRMFTTILTTTQIAGFYQQERHLFGV